MEFEIFKTGVHTSSNGITKEYTAEDLDLIAKTYNPDVSEAPIVIGHPKNNSPAYGWIESVKRVGDKLFAKAKDLLPEFVELLKQGIYKKRSISLDKDGKLVHVGFLGGKAPAVKGLADIKFSDSKDIISFEISDFKNPVYDIVPDLSEEFKPEVTSISKIPSDFANSESLDISDKQLSVDKVIVVSKGSQTFSSIQNSIDDLKITFEKFLENNDFASGSAEIKQAQDRIAELNFKIHVNEFELYLNEKLAYGTLTPAIKTKILDLMNFFKKNTFSSQELDEYFTLFTSFVDSFPRMISFDDFAEDEKNNSVKSIDEFKNFTLDKQSELIHKEAMKLVDSENISYSEAVNKIIYAK